MNRPPSAQDEKTARLAAALRENLKRRKAQARQRRDGEVAPRQQEPPDAQAETTRS